MKSERLNVPSRSRTNLDDPRPPQFRNMEGYTDFVRNQVNANNSRHISRPYNFYFNHAGDMKKRQDTE